MRSRMLATLAAVVLVGCAGNPPKSDRVYRAGVPYWWGGPAAGTKCGEPDDGAAVWCNAGAWDIPALNARGGEDAIAALGSVGVRPTSGWVSLRVWTVIRDRDATIICGPEALKLERIKQPAKALGTEFFAYELGASRSRVEKCLRKPLALSVDGRTYRLDTTMLREALTKAMFEAGM